MRADVPTKMLTLRFPEDVCQWLHAQAGLNLTNMNAEALKAIRTAMARSQKKAPEELAR